MYFNIGIAICDTIGFLRIMNLVKVLLSIVRIVIPIILIVILMKDLFMNVFDPGDKKVVGRIAMRVVAAAIIFFIPTIIDGVLWVVDYIASPDTDYTANSCYKNANNACIKTVNTYLRCDDAENTEYSNCMAYRSCNSYKLSSDCSLSTVENEDCAKVNSSFRKFSKSGYKYTGK